MNNKLSLINRQQFLNNNIDISCFFRKNFTATHEGITYSADSKRTGIYHVEGTSTGASLRNVYTNTTQIPSWLEKGHQYTVNYNATDSHIGFRVICYIGGTATTILSTVKSATFTIPENATGIIFRLYVPQGYAVDGDVSLSIFNTSAEDEIMYDLSDYNSFDILRRVGTYENKVVNGISYSWTDNSCSITGTNTNDSFINLIYSPSELPPEFKTGKKYRFLFENEGTESRSGATKINVITYLNGETTGGVSQYIYGDTDIEIPNNCTGIIVRIRVSGSTTGIEVNKTFRNIRILNTYTNEELSLLIDNHAYKINSEDVALNLAYPNRTHQGITFAWNDGTCTVSGTSVGTALDNLYYDEANIPAALEKGKTYWVTANISEPHTYLEVLVFRGDGLGSTSYNINFGKPIYIPYNAVGFALRLRVPQGYTVNGTISNIHVYKNYSYSMPQKIITFVDDDTSNDTYVTRYHDACVMNGFVGNYAVMTKHIEDGDTSSEKLLEYEDEGFGMLFHAYYQSGYANWSEGTYRNVAECRKNIAKGLRQMQEYGFCNYKYWITPGGNKDADMESLARYFGFECLVSTANKDYNHCKDASRYYIKRVAFNPDDSVSDKGLEYVKSQIDAFMDDSENGWLIITTHFNEWETAGHVWNEETGYSRFNELVEYAKEKGCDFKSFQEAWSFYKPYCID